MDAALRPSIFSAPAAHIPAKPEPIIVRPGVDTLGCMVAHVPSKSRKDRQHPVVVNALGIVYCGCEIASRRYNKKNPHLDSDTVCHHVKDNRERLIQEALLRFPRFPIAPGIVAKATPAGIIVERELSESEVAHWESILAIDPEKVVVVGGICYSLGEEPELSDFNTRGQLSKSYHFGHNGRRFRIRFVDDSRGELVTHNLWSRGPIPKQYRNRLPNNAIFMEGK